MGYNIYLKAISHLSQILSSGALMHMQTAKARSACLSIQINRGLCSSLADSSIIARGGLRGGSVEPHFDSKIHFHGKFWKNLEYGIHPKYLHPCTLLYASLQQIHFTAYECVQNS